MKLLRRKDGPSLDDRLTALAQAAGLADGRLPATAVSGALAVTDRAGVRRSLSVDHTVAALAGATGSGKSSLFNVLSGTELAQVGVRRPTTSSAQAALWDGQGSGPLLDWLAVPTRHEVTGDGLDGLILLDLPDHDSIELSHRMEVDRLVELVDLLVWVVDPQKYADAAVHSRYLRPLARHRDVMVVVLNQVDRLPPDAVERCLADLRRLLADDGLEGVPVLGVSARTGAGLGELRTLLADRTGRRRAWSERLAADTVTAADALAASAHTLAPVTSPGQARGGGAIERGAAQEARAGASSSPLPLPPGAGAASSRAVETGAKRMAVGDKRTAGLDKRLTRALSEAAGVPLVVNAVAKAHTHRAIAATGWPVTRWLRRFRPDPLRRLRVEGPGRSSIPAATAVQTAQVDTAIRDVAGQAGEGLPAAWAAAVRRAAAARSGELPAALDKVVGRTSVEAARRPRWWKAVGLLQWLIFATMVAGAVWLGVLFAMGYLQLPEPPTPTVGELPWPTVLLLGGAVAGLLVALLSRLAAWLGGRRRASRAARSLQAAVGEVSAAYVLEPVAEELARFGAFEEALKTARG
ncbi:GTPase [Nonomuraea soli]|uniref:GTP-binding protein EngB required for normal cell division n=1 Tax=Nonomuraea soli TaxID=1032476 RepID=A0A7W0HTT4_9ACTN|nr:GTPase [Nonomuraea soli]MBA2895282.1 GTP-binding protein EngB required for normal cell division [Nonomuraea soli]